MTPFRGVRRDETFDNVIKAPLCFPAKPQISEECRDLISRLLVKDPAQRLGTRTGEAPVPPPPSVLAHAHSPGRDHAVVVGGM